MLRFHRRGYFPPAKKRAPNFRFVVCWVEVFRLVLVCLLWHLALLASIGLDVLSRTHEARSLHGWCLTTCVVQCVVLLQVESCRLNQFIKNKCPGFSSLRLVELESRKVCDFSLSCCFSNSLWPLNLPQATLHRWFGLVWIWM